MFDRRQEFTVTDLARIAGANPRSVQHWAAQYRADTTATGAGKYPVLFGCDVIIGMEKEDARKQSPEVQFERRLPVV